MKSLTAVLCNAPMNCAPGMGFPSRNAITVGRLRIWRYVMPVSGRGWGCRETVTRTLNCWPICIPSWESVSIWTRSKGSLDVPVSFPSAVNSSRMGDSMWHGRHQLYEELGIARRGEARNGLGVEVDQDHTILEGLSIVDELVVDLRGACNELWAWGTRQTSVVPSCQHWGSA